MATSSFHVDPVTGLTERQIELVKTAYEVVKNDQKAAGQQLFILFYEKNPEYLNFFPFKNVPIPDLPSSPKFQSHVAAVLRALTEVIDNLHDSSTLVDLLKKLGNLPVHRRVAQEHFDAIRAAFLVLMGRLLGPKFDDETSKAVNKALQVAFKVIVDAIKTQTKH